MLSLISPSKNLDFTKRVRSRKKTNPVFLEDATSLVATMQEFDANAIRALMNISDDLATLNEERYKTWDTNGRRPRQAVLAFRGEVYLGLDARSLSEGELTSAQRRLRILSGLYGVLRPLDLIQPYRLEMGLPVATSSAANLYEFWGDRIVTHLNDELAQHRNPILINLASDEYFKAVDTSRINYPVVRCQFLDKFRDNYRFMSFYGKRARGLMARHIVTEKIDNLAGLKRFSSQGYRYEPTRSTKTRLVFIRDEPVTAQA